MSFYLKDMNNDGDKFTIYVGWDGDITLSMIGGTLGRMRFTNVRIGMGPNSGDPNDNVKDIKYIKKALKSLAMEFQYQNGDLTEEQIKEYREETYKHI